MEGRQPTWITLALGSFIAIVFFFVLFRLAYDADWMRGLDRELSLSFEFDLGQLILGILGGVAALWAAKTFATSTGKAGPEATPPGEPRLKPDPDNAAEVLFAADSYDDKFMTLFRLLRNREQG